MKKMVDYRSKTLETLIGQSSLKINNRQLLISKNTRRMMKYAYRTKQLMARHKMLRQALYSSQQNFVTRQSVKVIREAFRKPNLRVRSRNEMNMLQNATISYSVNRIPMGVAPIWHWEGSKGTMVDHHPILKLDPPRNWMYAQRYKVYGLKNAFKCDRDGIKIDAPMSKWAIEGLRSYSVPDLTGIAVNWSDAYANEVLAKAIAKVYEADIQTNEYIFEWKQVLDLLKNPLRTVVKAHKVLERWTRRDSWIWLPQRVARKCGRGTLVSHRSPGGVLMSMRTKRELHPDEVSDQMLEAAANRWLQYRYGIAPLASDITKVMELWMNPAKAFPLRSESARIWISRSKEENDYTYRISPMDCVFKTTRTFGHFYSAKVWYTLRGPVPAAYKAGMHPSQFLNVLWNAAPWSFVADWVVNVDQWLTSSMDVDWIQLVGNVVTVKDFTKVKARCISAKYFTAPSSPCTIVKEPLAIKVMERVKRRVDLPRPTGPVVSMKWASVKNLTTYLALIYQPIIRSFKHAN